MRKIRILFLVADPWATPRSELEARMRNIRRELQNFKNLVFDAEWVESLDELREELDFYQPHVVHFVGSSVGNGISLSDHAGMRIVGQQALSLLFTDFSRRIRLAILDACYVSEQAEALTRVIDCVVNMNNNVDASNTSNAATLYSYISQGYSLQEIFKHDREIFPSLTTLPELLRRPLMEDVVLLPSTHTLPLITSPMLPGDNREQEPLEESKTEPINLFIAYTPNERILRDQLLQHLNLLVNQGIINIWPDGDVSQEKEWQQGLEHFHKAKVILLLISQDFLISKFSRGDEMSRAIARHKNQEAYVISVLLRPVTWEGTPFSTLLTFPVGGKSIVEWSDRDEALREVVRNIRLVVEEIQKGSFPPLDSSPTLPAQDQSSTLVSPSVPSHKLEDVFVRIGTPEVTFVESEDFPRLKRALAVRGRGIIVEGPSGIGKTTAVQKAVREIQAVPSTAESVGTTITVLSCVVPADLDKLRKLEDLQGTIIIDDFHHLDRELSEKIGNHLKSLADSGQEAKKLVLVGIPQSGQHLISLSYDLASRIDIFPWKGKVDNKLVLQMIEKGEKSLNIKLERKAELALTADGSLNLAQFLCYYVCEEANVLARQEQLRHVSFNISVALARLKNYLSTKFDEAIECFAALGGPNDDTCLQLLEELAASEDALLFLNGLKRRRNGLAPGITRFISEKWMDRLYQEHPESEKYFFFDRLRGTLVADDPQFTFYLRNISFPSLAREVGKDAPVKRQKVFIGYQLYEKDDNRDDNKRIMKWLERLGEYLVPLEKEGIIDPWESKRILADQDWKKEVFPAIETAKVAILLVTQEFLNSDFIMNEQVSKLLLQVQVKGTTIIPLIVEPCSVQTSPLKVFQPANLGMPLNDMTRRNHWRKTFVKLAEDIRAILT
jgi:hypothetical protein